MVLIGCSICVAIVFLFLFLQEARRGAFDDVQEPAWRMLLDDDASLRQQGPSTNASAPIVNEQSLSEKPCHNGDVQIR